MYPERVLDYIDQAIPLNPSLQTNIAHIPDQDIQDTMDVVWALLTRMTKATGQDDVQRQQVDKLCGVVLLCFTGLPGVVRKGREKDKIEMLICRISPRVLRRLLTKLALKKNLLQTELYLSGVSRDDKESFGRGSFAEIYTGTWRREVVALKKSTVNKGATSAEEKLKLICREAVIWSALRHEHILPLYGLSADAFESGICMVMPLMKNGNIKDHIEKLRIQHKLGGYAFVRKINTWLFQIAQGLQYLHEEGVIHGDLHGGNILIDQNDNVRLSDFGLSLISTTSESDGTQYGPNHAGGACQFKAPELHDHEAFGLEDARPTSATDVYSLAIICVELYTGDVPFPKCHDFKVYKIVANGGRPSRPVTKDLLRISDAAWELVNRCWSHQPQNRPSATVVAAQLGDIVEAEKAIEVPAALQCLQVQTAPRALPEHAAVRQINPAKMRASHQRLKHAGHQDVASVVPSLAVVAAMA